MLFCVLFSPYAQDFRRYFYLYPFGRRSVNSSLILIFTVKLAFKSISKRNFINLLTFPRMERLRS